MFPCTGDFDFFMFFPVLGTLIFSCFSLYWGLWFFPFFSCSADFDFLCFSLYWGLWFFQVFSCTGDFDDFFIFPPVLGTLIFFMTFPCTGNFDFSCISPVLEIINEQNVDSHLTWLKKYLRFRRYYVIDCPL